MPRKHRLPRPLMVSLTSHPERFDSIHLTLSCLLNQSIEPDTIVLWISYKDRELLPDMVKTFCCDRVSIRFCQDLGPFNKLVHAIAQNDGRFIATADDDIYYPEDWLEVLERGCLEDIRVITAHRCHRVRVSSHGQVEPYAKWEQEVRDELCMLPSSDVFPTGVGGILYPPNSMHFVVTDSSTFLKLCPTGDDLWFFWCARLLGTKVRKVGKQFNLRYWDGTQNSALWRLNFAGQNDTMINALVSEFGLPIY